MKQTQSAAKPSDLPVYLFHQGNNFEAYRYFGSHLEEQDGQPGAVFRVWAPHAKAVSVVGDFNSWVPTSHPMEKVSDGIWELFIPGIKIYDVYKYCITTRRMSWCTRLTRMRSMPKPARPTAAKFLIFPALTGTMPRGRCAEEK